MQPKHDYAKKEYKDFLRANKELLQEIQKHLIELVNFNIQVIGTDKSLFAIIERDDTNWVEKFKSIISGKSAIMTFMSYESAVSCFQPRKKSIMRFNLDKKLKVINMETNDFLKINRNNKKVEEYRYYLKKSQWTPYDIFRDILEVINRNRISRKMDQPQLSIPYCKFGLGYDFIENYFRFILGVSGILLDNGVVVLFLDKL